MIPAAKTPHPIETLFPARRVHLIGGSSGSGKTTWLLQMLDNWQKGEKVFGYEVNPQPFLIISYDRGDEEFRETCARVKLDESRFPRISPSGASASKSLLGLLTDLRVSHPAVRFFVVEGIAIKTPDGKINDYKVVGEWLNQLRAFCETNDITIVGVVHSPKTHEGEQYVDPRTRITGSGAWGAYSSSIVLVEKAAPSEPADTTRKLYFLLRNGPERMLLMDFRDGLMYEQVRMSSEQKIIAFCVNRDVDAIHSKDDFRAVTGLKDSQLEAVLASLVTIGRIERLEGRGKYKFRPPTASA